MKIILLSGGSGKRLWPLSNDARSKQFLRLLTSPSGERESMIQRVVRQIRESGIEDEILVATAASQKDAVELQLGDSVTVLTEPERRSTFPAISLAASYLASQGVKDDEVVVAMPCDTFAEDAYFNVIKEMAEAAARDDAQIVLMGTRPLYPSEKYGYILPAKKDDGKRVMHVERFAEKPAAEKAARLMEEGALWNGGVFAFKLEYLTNILRNYTCDIDFQALRKNYSHLPKISFDFEVVEKCPNLAMVPFYGAWKDLGTWNTLTDELRHHQYGNVKTENTHNSFILNELEMPLVCIGAKNMVVAASPDGILVTDRKQSENLKHIVNEIEKRPMYEERRWGEYKVIDNVEFDDGFCALTKQLTLRPGCSISYQRHTHRDEVWTFIDGEGEIVINDLRKAVKRGDIIHIPKGDMHALRAKTSLTFIEVQQGSHLIEEDIERFPYDWE